jgi:hypothetical protein
MINPLKKQNEFYFDIDGVLFTIHMMVIGCIGGLNLFKIEIFCELFMFNKDSREIKWFSDSRYRKEVVG